MSPLIIRPVAAAEIDEAYLWYESRRTGFGEEFLAEVNGTLDTIREMPELYAVVHRDTRRAMLVRFPYSQIGWTHNLIRFRDAQPQIGKLQRQSQRAAEARTLLLPRLMSGEIAI